MRMLYYLTELVEEEGFRLCESLQSSERIRLLGFIVGNVVYEQAFSCAVSDEALKGLHEQMISFYKKNYDKKENEFKDLTRFAN